ncbi:MAG TPA: toll-Interleukin receptor [Chryseobacterium sp.]|nr:toll-Interleukin receptor [Chryseobacterium sp.]
MKLFISYSHKDEDLINEFIAHISPLRDNGIIEEWYDRKILAGDDFQNNIDQNIESSDIVCLMISENFLASKACIQEKNIALKLKEQKNIRVIAVILKPCLWNEYYDLSKSLAVPTDGKPIISFSNHNEGWVDALKWIKSALNQNKIIQDLKFRSSFSSFLDSTEILSKAHGNREALKIDDIFVSPNLFYNQSEKNEKVNFDDLKENVLEYDKILLVGENQSGKTSLIKSLIKKYKELRFVPVYISEEMDFMSNPMTILEKAFKNQYENFKLEDLPVEKIVPIIDNFHLAKNKQKFVDDFASYKHQVFVVDDIYSLNFKNTATLKEYNVFRIRKFTALERYELIKKWVEINETKQIEANQNHLHKSVDEKIEIIENSLGIVFGKGIMPSYPFFILSVLASLDIYKPLDQDITSQGYCYQSLIYLYLRKENVTNEQVDIYLNFLTQLSYRIFENQGNGLAEDEFKEFQKFYEDNYNLPIPIDELIRTLSNVNICKFDTLNFYNFSYNYLYYFFVGKYLSENIEKNKKVIDRIIANLHKDENAYITIFMSHHKKSDYLLDEILLNAETLFENYQPAKLDTKELSFFDKHENALTKALLPDFQEHSYEHERKKDLIRKSEREENDDVLEKTNPIEDDDFGINLRLSIKTVEVMGNIIKNRSGSLELPRLIYIYEQGLKLHLRILNSFIEIIKDEETEKIIIDYLKEKISKILDNNDSQSQNKLLTLEQKENIIRKLFWNMNFNVIFGFISKSIHSLGSSNLMNIAKSINEKEKTPASFLVYQGILMWYGKILKIDEIAERIDDKDFSKISERIIKLKVVDHVRTHKISFQANQKIQNKLNIETKKLLIDRLKSDEKK